MRKIVGVVAFLYCLSLSNVANSAELFFGVEQGKYAAPSTDDFNDNNTATVRHSWTVARMDWAPSEILLIHLCLGGQRSDIDDTGLAPSIGTQDDRYFNHFGIGIGLDQELDTGGALIIGVSANWTSSEWTDATNGDYTYDAMLTKFHCMYAFLDPGKARPYLGVSYNTYEGDLKNPGGANPDVKLMPDARINLVAGVRAKTDTVYGIMEATLGGEFGVKLGLEFSF